MKLDKYIESIEKLPFENWVQGMLHLAPWSYSDKHRYCMTGWILKDVFCMDNDSIDATLCDAASRKLGLTTEQGKLLFNINDSGIKTDESALAEAKRQAIEFLKQVEKRKQK